MLDAITDYLPSPLDVAPAIGIMKKIPEKLQIHPDSNKKFSALAFKVQMDKYVGKVIYIRVYSGSIKRGGDSY